MEEFHVVLVKSNIPSVILTQDKDQYEDKEGLHVIGSLIDSCTEDKNPDCFFLKSEIVSMLGRICKEYYQISWDLDKNIMNKLIISFDEDSTNG